MINNEDDKEKGLSRIRILRDEADKK